MRPSALALFALPLAGPLAAQNAGRFADREPAPVLQTLTFDVAEAFQDRWRVSMEPLAFGRFTVGIAGAYTTHRHDQPYPIGYVPYCPPNVLCASGPYDDGSSYKAWNFDLGVRWYPALLSSRGGRQALGLYVGEFIGYHRRRILLPSACPYCYPLPLDSGIIAPPYPPYGFSAIIDGFEPGVEAGLRLIPMRHVVLDLGARIRVATLDDPFAGPRAGGTDTRLLVTVGIGK